MNEEHRERIYMVLAELFFNALDHGLLKLDSRLKETPQGFGEYYSQRTKRLADLQKRAGSRSNSVTRKEMTAAVC
jgi:hypothetical protein